MNNITDNLNKVLVDLSYMVHPRINDITITIEVTENERDLISNRLKEACNNMIIPIGHEIKDDYVFNSYTSPYGTINFKICEKEI